MTPERWRKIEELYHVAQARDSNDRSAFLAEACQGDVELHREVEALLAQDEGGKILDRPAAELLTEPTSQPNARSLSAGDKLGPYEIVAFVGAGGMGEVYKAQDTRLRRNVALKVLPTGVGRDPTRRQRFEREGRAISSLNHPYICSLYDVGSQDGVDYLVMEYVEGTTLADRLRKGPVSIAEALRIGIQIAEALDAAHRRGVVHRDLKPGNVMLAKSSVKLLDFGLAKLTGAPAPTTAAGSKPAASAQPLTQKGLVMGTFQYMSPEQCEGKESDARSDIFALGAVLYETITGRRAFEGESQASVIAAILERDPAAPSSLRAGIPPMLDRVMATCLAKDPDRRWQSANEVRHALEWAAASSGTTATASALPSPEQPRKALVSPWIAAAIFALASLILAFQYLRKTPQEQAGSAPTRFIVEAPEGTALVDEQVDGGSAISPDGRRLAFVASDTASNAKQQRLWMRSLDSVSARPLAGTEGAAYPFWSPDSRFIGFFAHEKLKNIDAAGISVQVICDAPDGDATSAWNQDGVILFTSGPLLYSVPAAGGKPTPVTSLDTSRNEISHRWVQFLPDGRHFLYTAFVNESVLSAQNALYVESLDSGTITRSGSKDRIRLLHSEWKAAYAPSVHGGTGYVLFWRDHSLMAQPFDPKKLALSGEPVAVAEQNGDLDRPCKRPFSVSDNGTLAFASSLSSEAMASQIVWYDRAGRRLSAVGEPGRHETLSLSLDQKQLVTAVFEKNIEGCALWVFDLFRNTARRFTFNPSLNIRPLWSPDGTRIIFASNRDGALSLYLKAASGAGNEEEILRSESGAWPTDWSRDGRFLVYDEEKPRGDKGNLKATWRLMVLPLEGKHKPFPFVDAEFSEWMGAFSPDGRWLAYMSDESGKQEVYVQTFTGVPGTPAGAGKWLISTRGGCRPRWQRDGKKLFYFEGETLMAVDVTSGASFQAGAPTPLFDPKGAAWYDVAADGRRFIVLQPVEQAQAHSPITVVLNWQAGLNR